MQYPDRLIPLGHFKPIDTDLSGFFLCRMVASNELLTKVNDVFPLETLCANDKELFDYSTNLPGHFLLEDNKIRLIGENKKYFYEYWDFSECVNLPIFQQDFDIDQNRTHFFLPISRIHKRICIPCPTPPKKDGETLTAVVIHTPTRSNFWHFSIRWLDNNDNVDVYKSADWRKRMSSTMRHVLQELIDISTPVELKLVPEHCFIKAQ
jgi:hypothetical protein